MTVRELVVQLRGIDPDTPVRLVLDSAGVFAAPLSGVSFDATGDTDDPDRDADACGPAVLLWPPDRTRQPTRSR
jgi:hypothetical protein